MNRFYQGVAAAGLIALAACGGQTPAENAAENIREATENEADMLEEQGANMSENILEVTENQAAAVREAGENRADAIEDAAASNSVNGM